MLSNRQATLLAVLALLTACDDGVRPEADEQSELYLWVWQRDEDLSFIDPATTKIALWVATITVDDRGVDIAARENTVLYPSNSEILAVVRLEIMPGFESDALDVLGPAIASLIGPLRVSELQIDFDARRSQRAFYRDLIGRLTSQLPAQRLSITALASWCYGDPWIAELPIAAAVPMYFRMGEDGGQISGYLRSGRQIPATICADNAGYSLDEPAVPPTAVPRLFVFSPEPWNEDRLQRARELFVR